MLSTHSGNVVVCSNAEVSEGLVHVRRLLLLQQLQANNNVHITETSRLTNTQRIKLVRFASNPPFVTVCSYLHCTKAFHPSINYCLQYTQGKVG